MVFFLSLLSSLLIGMHKQFLCPQHSIQGVNIIVCLLFYIASGMLSEGFVLHWLEENF